MLDGAFDGTQNMNLFSLSNQVMYSNLDKISNSGNDSGSVYFSNYWIATSHWDFIVDFEWNFSDVIDPLTGNTRYIAVNPIFEGYGSVEGAFEFHFNENWWIKLSGYINPARAEVLNTSFWYPINNYPTWWARS